MLRRGLLFIVAACCLPGCWVVRVAVQNPIPDMTVVAVAPFFNLTQEPSEVVDGRRFALAYYAELQKTAGFQVIPLGVVETALLEHKLDLSRKEDVLRLAEVLQADAVVIGAVTDYHPYYPPRIGLQVDWYSPRTWEFEPWSESRRGFGGLGRHPEGKHAGRKWYQCWGESEPPPVELRGQSPDFEPPTPVPPRAALTDVTVPNESQTPPVRSVASQPAPPFYDPGLEPLPEPTARPWTPPPPDAPPFSPPASSLPPPTGLTGTGVLPLDSVNVREPLMSYTRLFDGADQDVVDKLRDYLELRGDRRSGGWEAHLHRSEDFIRFSAHLMIVEMLALHGGAVRSQVVFKWRTYQ